jgi:hypothetical protein
MVRLLILLAFVAGCPPPSIYRVERPGLGCERATRVAYRTMTVIGYTITELVQAHPERPGLIVGTTTGPDGEPVTNRVVIHCDGRGVVLQPVEESLFPTYDFSREFGYSFKSLIQRPDVEVPSAGKGLEVLVHAVSVHEALLDLDGVPTRPDAVAVRVTVRNHTDRTVRIEPADIELVAPSGTGATALTGAAFDGALVAGAAAGRVRAEALRATTVAPGMTVTGFLVYPAAAYAEARLTITDVETAETEGFVTPVE